MKWLLILLWLLFIVVFTAYGGWPAPAKAANPAFQWPTVGCPLTSIHGWNGTYAHIGIDLGCFSGHPIVSANAGTVVYAGWDLTGYGNRIDVYDQAGDNLTRYGHLSQLGVTYGQWVEKGQPLGLVGQTGNAYGPHLHLEIMWQNTPVDPLIVLP